MRKTHHWLSSTCYKSRKHFSHFSITVVHKPLDSLMIITVVEVASFLDKNDLYFELLAKSDVIDISWWALINLTFDELSIWGQIHCHILNLLTKWNYSYSITLESCLCGYWEGQFHSIPQPAFCIPRMTWTMQDAGRRALQPTHSHKHCYNNTMYTAAVYMNYVECRALQSTSCKHSTSY